MLALIDADSIVFRCGFAVQHKTYVVWGEGTSPLGSYQKKRDIPKEYSELHLEVQEEIEPVENALHLVKQSLEFIINETGATDYKVYIKGKGNFRDELSVTRKYKGNRDAAHRPKYEVEIRDYLKKYWKAEEVDGMEVDDKVAIEQCDAHLRRAGNLESPQTGSTIICTGDKDLNMIPGWHYDFIHNNRYWVTGEEAVRFFYTQLLTGDASDNIQGIKGIGPRTAESLLKDCKTDSEMFLVCKEEYKKAYGEHSEEILEEMANLLWIRQAEEDTWPRPNVN